MFYCIPEVTRQRYNSITASKIHVRQKDLNKLKHNLKSNRLLHLNKIVVTSIQKQSSPKWPVSS